MQPKVAYPSFLQKLPPLLPFEISTDIVKLENSLFVKREEVEP